MFRDDPIGMVFFGAIGLPIFVIVILMPRWLARPLARRGTNPSLVMAVRAIAAVAAASLVVSLLV